MREFAGVFWFVFIVVIVFGGVGGGITGHGFDASRMSIFLSCDLVQSLGQVTLHDSLMAA